MGRLREQEREIGKTETWKRGKVTEEGIIELS